MAKQTINLDLEALGVSNVGLQYELPCDCKLKIIHRFAQEVLTYLS
jgi:hypothetical protein